MAEDLGRLYEMEQKFPCCDYWNDSCAIDDLEYAVARDVRGATTNPVIVKNVLKKEMPLWRDTIVRLIETMPEATEEDVAWALMKTIAQERSKLLLPVFEKYKGKKGRISIQVNARNYRSVGKMAEQAAEFAALAPNMQVKIPCSAAGIAAMEEATYRGISINATVSFTVAQTLAVAEAVERGLKRREAEGLPIDTMSPVCTLMFGRVEDYVKQYVNDSGLLVDPNRLNWVAVAVFKHAYKLYRERGYRLRLLASGFRHAMHWTEIIGAACAMTINHGWQARINDSSAPVEKTIDRPVPDEALNTLLTIQEFVKAYDENGLTPAQFEHYGVFRHTLASFLEGYDELLGIIRGFMLPAGY